MKKIYLAIPYSGMRESSYRQANQATADIMNMGYNPFSPITHSHPLTDFGVPGDWDFWKKIDMDWIDVCDELWVLIPQEGLQRVQNSTGVQAEIEYALKTETPVYTYLRSEDRLIHVGGNPNKMHVSKEVSK